VKIYTKKGDLGETSLFRGGLVSKDSVRVEAYGAVDELNCHLGWVRTHELEKGIVTLLNRVQLDLFIIGSDLSTPPEAVKEGDSIMRLAEDAYLFMETAIDDMEQHLEPLSNFILPGGSQTAVVLHTARAVCRRTERAVVTLACSESVNPVILVYLNRLSDMLFVMARFANKIEGRLDMIWEKGSEG